MPLNRMQLSRQQAGHALAVIQEIQVSSVLNVARRNRKSRQDGLVPVDL